MNYQTVECKLKDIASKYGKTLAKHPFKGYNFMTNNIICKKMLKDNVWYELSYGTGISTNYIVGVTVVNNKAENIKEYSQCVTIDNENDFSEVENIIKAVIADTELV